MSLTVFRYRFKKLGGHIHVRIFSGEIRDPTPHMRDSLFRGRGPALAKVGDLTLDERDWEAFKMSLRSHSLTRDGEVIVAVVPEYGCDDEGEPLSERQFLA